MVGTEQAELHRSKIKQTPHERNLLVSSSD